MADIKSVCEAGDVLASPTAGDVECSIEQEGTRAFQQRVSSYDSYGRLQNLVLQEGYTYSAFAYDGEDEPTQYQTSNGWCNNDGTFAVCPTSTNAFTYSARGELLQTSMNGTTTTRQSADGFMCTPSSGGCQESFDSRSDMLLSAKGFTYSYNGYGWQTSVKNGGTVTRSYDADGHLTLQQNASSATLPCTSYQYGCDPGANVVDVGTQGEYSWGPTGRIANYVDDLLGARYTNGPPSFSEHWDELTGDLLFENVSTGGAIQGNQQSNFNIGRLGVSNASNGVTVEDRDPFGQIAATHDSYGFAAWTALRPTQPLKLGQPYSSAQGSNYPSTDPQSASRILDGSRPDAYVDQTYGVSFQGVRAADANTTQWLTPDPFDGDAGDPMSQQPYTWNNNNGVMYQDPTGYDACLDGSAPFYKANSSGGGNWMCDDGSIYVSAPPEEDYSWMDTSAFGLPHIPNLPQLGLFLLPFVPRELKLNYHYASDVEGWVLSCRPPGQGIKSAEGQGFAGENTFGPITAMLTPEQQTRRAYHWVMPTLVQSPTAINVNYFGRLFPGLPSEDGNPTVIAATCNGSS